MSPNAVAEPLLLPFVAAVLCTVLHARQLLPDRAFRRVPFGSGTVHALIMSPMPLTSMLHRGLLAWLQFDAPTLLAHRSHFFVQFVLRGATATATATHELYELSCRPTCAEHYEQPRLADAVQCVLRTLTLYCTTMQTAPVTDVVANVAEKSAIDDAMHTVCIGSVATSRTLIQCTVALPKQK